jgi:archaellum component FlaC
MNNESKGEKITLEALAAMMQREFTQTRKDMNDGFTVVKTRLDNIEKILISKQDEKIKKLEERIKRIEEMLPS